MIQAYCFKKQQVFVHPAGNFCGWIRRFTCCCPVKQTIRCFIDAVVPNR